MESYNRQFRHVRIVLSTLNFAYDIWTIKYLQFIKRPEEPKIRANKTGINSMIFILIFVENWRGSTIYMIFYYISLEPVLIQRILIVFEAILETEKKNINKE